MALTLTAVITFAFKTTGPAHSAARTDTPGPTSTEVTGTTNPSTTSLPATTLPSTPVNQLAQWWTVTGGPQSSALTADLESMQGDGTDTAQLAATHCTTFTGQVSAAGSAPPAPTPSIQREWLLTLSTAQRVVGACAAQKYSQVNIDLQPALYTIRDLTRQVGPYLSGRVP